MSRLAQWHIDDLRDRADRSEARLADVVRWLRTLQGPQDPRLLADEIEATSGAEDSLLTQVMCPTCKTAFGKRTFGGFCSERCQAELATEQPGEEKR